MSQTSAQTLMDFLCEQVARRSKVPPHKITPEAPLAALGLESIDAVLLCGDVEDHFQVEVDPADIFDHDTLGSFADAILARMKS